MDGQAFEDLLFIFERNGYLKPHQALIVRAMRVTQKGVDLECEIDDWAKHWYGKDSE